MHGMTMSARRLHMIHTVHLILLGLICHFLSPSLNCTSYVPVQCLRSTWPLNHCPCNPLALKQSMINAQHNAWYSLLACIYRAVRVQQCISPSKMRHLELSLRLDLRDGTRAQQLLHFCSSSGRARYLDSRNYQRRSAH
jgi:hypothetical protein